MLHYNATHYRLWRINYMPLSWTKLKPGWSWYSAERLMNKAVFDYSLCKNTQSGGEAKLGTGCTVKCRLWLTNQIKRYLWSAGSASLPLNIIYFYPHRVILWLLFCKELLTHFVTHEHRGMWSFSHRSPACSRAPEILCWDRTWVISIRCNLGHSKQTSFLYISKLPSWAKN